MQTYMILRSGLILLAASLALPASAKNVTINNITVDVPSSFQASEYKRGMEVKTDDDEVFVWFETSSGSETQGLVDEHNAYWKENDVALSDPVEETSTQTSGTQQKTLDFKSATWKGKPTVVRYVFIGPMGPAKSMVVYTLWASPEGFRAHGQEVMGMLQSMNARVEK